MDFIINNWYLIIAAIAVIVTGVYFAVKFFKMPSEKQLAKVREWLLYATAEAEKRFGDGMGKVQLRYVYDLFLSKFPWLAKIITFEKFSGLVDSALPVMKGLLEENKAFASYVNTNKE